MNKEGERTQTYWNCKQNKLDHLYSCECAHMCVSFCECERMWFYVKVKMFLVGEIEQDL